MHKTLIVYSTVGGNTELVVNQISQILSSNDFNVISTRVDVFKTETILDYDLVILASPTYNQGTLEDHFKPFMKELKKLDISNKKFAVVGLGSLKYYPEYLTEAATIFEDFLKKKNAILVVPALRITENPLKYLDSLIARWCQKIITQYQNN